MILFTFLSEMLCDWIIQTIYSDIVKNTFDHIIS